MGTSDWQRRLLRGAVAGTAGGLASGLVLWIFVQPTLTSAIALEESHTDAHAHTHGGEADSGEVVTRLQQQVGGTITVLVVGVLLGIAFAAIYGASRHRLPGRSEVGRSMTLAGLAFTVLALVPALLVPANPPGVGDPDTVDQRTLTYMSAILLTSALVVGVFTVAAKLRERGGSVEIRWIATSAMLIAGLTVLLTLFPRVHEAVPADISPDLMWSFRSATLAQAACLWATIGLGHGLLAHRAATATGPRLDASTAAAG